MANEQKMSVRTAVAAVFTGLLASACCIGPLALAILGIGGAGLLVKFEPYRPYFMTFTFLLLGAGFYFAYFRKPAVAEGGVDACGCEKPKQNKWGKVMLWVATVIAVVSMISPYLLAAFSDSSFSKANAGLQGATQVASQQIALDIKGMTCGGCVGHVTRALKGLSGISSAKVSFKPQRAVVRFNPKKVTTSQMIAAIKKVGYKASLSKTKLTKVAAANTNTITLSLSGMTCGGCAFNVKNALKKVNGILSAKVTYKPQRAVIQYNTQKANIQQMIQAIKKAGYKAKLDREKPKKRV